MQTQSAVWGAKPRNNIVFIILLIKNYLYTMYMTPYKKFYYYIIRCLNHFFFWQEKETLHLWPHLYGACDTKLLVLNNLQCHYYEYSNKRKSACSLRSPNGSKGRSLPAHFTMKHGFMMKKALFLSRWLCKLPWIKIFQVPIYFIW